jgi:23S rRNA-/tRNA-specific pseudouridylate synthase
MQAPTILYEDEVLLVCNKPAGLMVEPDRNNFPNLLQDVKNYLKATTGEKLPYVQHLHRLDRPTSGIVLFTKQKEYLRNLSEQFAQREVSKVYLALTKTAPLQLEGRLEHWHRKEKKKAVLVPEGTEFAEKAILEYKVKSHNQDLSVRACLVGRQAQSRTDKESKHYLWEIKLHTGKYHQIRVQLASLDCPILGDEIYGSTDKYKPNEIALHAWKLKIKHPVTNEEIEFVAENDLNDNFRT